LQVVNMNGTLRTRIDGVREPPQPMEAEQTAQNDGWKPARKRRKRVVSDA
jgi:hypothetical protein